MMPGWVESEYAEPNFEQEVTGGGPAEVARQGPPPLDLDHEASILERLVLNFVADFLSLEYACGGVWVIHFRIY